MEGWVVMKRSFLCLMLAAFLSSCQSEEQGREEVIQFQAQGMTKTEAILLANN